MKKLLTFSILAYLSFTINSSGITQNHNNSENEKVLKIGVLLPLSGKFQDIGESFLKAIQLGLYDISNENVKIYPKDSKANALHAYQSAKEFEEQGIKVVIGPIFYESLERLNEINNITFISLTNKTQKISNNTIAFGININSQIDVLKKYFNKIKVSSTRTDKVPNTSASAASSTTDLNGAAAINAVNKIKLNLASFVKKKYKLKTDKATYENGKVKFNSKVFAFNSLVKDAYLNRVSLSSSGFYSTPKIHFNNKTFSGRPFLYFCYGAAVSEVLIDTLTGENKILRVDILHDQGRAINPAIEKGQIEGGFVQGAGWLTIEEVNWKSNGELTTHSPSTYKIPAVNDMPEKFNVKIFKNINKENVVNKSKTTGEPPLMLGMSVFFAIKDAIASVGNYKIIPNLNAPATPEAILLSINDIKKKL